MNAFHTEFKFTDGFERAIERDALAAASPDDDSAAMRLLKPLLVVSAAIGIPLITTLMH